MHLTSAFLVATCLASVAFAGPTWYSSSCASECQQQRNYFYEIGQTYEYDYEVDTRTFIEGTSEESSDTMIRAKVLIQPTSQCEHSLTLKDVTILGSAKSQDFAEAVTKESIRFSFQNGKIDNVCASDSDPEWVLNFKKGILSSFQNSMSELEGTEIVTEKDISGICETKYSAEHEGKITKVSRTKDLLSCKNNAHNTINKLSSFGYSAETFLQDLPLFEGHQECVQEIVNEKIESVVCEQSFLLRPFSKNKSGATTKVSTKLVLSSITSESQIPTGRFSHKTSLEFEDITIDSDISSEKTVEEILSRLEYLTENGVSKEVPALFSELVVFLRKLDFYKIRSLYEQNDEFVQKFLQDALLLVGTADSMQMVTNLIQQDVLSTKDQEAWITSLSFIKNPSLQMFSAIQPLFGTKIGVTALLGVSSMVHNYCNKDTTCENNQEIINIVKTFESFLGVSCRATSDEEKINIIFALKALGNAGVFVNAKSILDRCYTEDNDMEIRITAIEAWRRTPSSYPRNNLLAAFQDRSQDNEIRIASYLAVMVHPTTSVIAVVKDSLISEGVNQVSSFVWTHLTNLQESAFSDKQAIRELIGEELLQKKFNPEALKFSRNYESSIMLDHLNVGGMVEGNVIFSSQSFLPRSAMINFNVDAFGEPMQLLEIGGRMESFESYIEKFFGKDGYYPEETIEGILRNLRQQKQEEETTLEKYLIKSSNDPEGSLYVKIFGNELSYRHFNSLTELMPEFGFENPMDMIIELLSKGNVDFTKSFNIIDTDFNYPTIAGLPLNLKLNGAATLGLKIEGNFAFEGFTSMDIQGSLHPSAAITIDGSMGIDTFVTKSGIKISSSMHSSSHIEGKAVVNGGKIVDFEINLPKDNDVVFEFTNEIFRIEDGQEVKEEFRTIPYKNCLPLVTVSACYETEISLPSYYSPYFPLSNSVEAKVYLIKTESSSPIKFQYRNEEHLVSLLAIIPHESKDVGFSASYNKREQELKFNIDHPTFGLNHFGRGLFHLNGDENEVSFMIGKNEQELYAAKIIYNQNISKNSKSLSFEITNWRGKLLQFDGRYKFDVLAGEYLMDVEVSSIVLQKQTVKFEYNAPKKHLEVDVQIAPVDLKLKTDISSNGEEKYFDVNGKLHVRGIFGPKTFTGRGTCKPESTLEGKKYSGTMEIEEFGLKYDWNFALSKYEISNKMSGIVMNVPFNIDISSYKKKNDDSHIDMNYKILANIPAFGVDFVLSRMVFFDATTLRSTYDCKYNDYVSISKKIDWKFGESLEADLNFKVINSHMESHFSSVTIDDSTKITYDSRGNFGKSFDILGTLNIGNIPDRFNAEFEGEAILQNSQVYKTKWDVNADREELNLQGWLDCSGKLCTIFAKATPTSINVSNTFYKPLSIEANMVTVGESREILISTSSEDNTFRVEGKISPNDVYGTIKIGELDIGISGTYNPQDINAEVWISSEEKISFSASKYITRKSYSEVDALILATVTTPYRGFEKQDLKIKYSNKSGENNTQLSFTWANDHHLTISSFTKMSPYLVFSSNIKTTSTVDMLDNIVMKIDHYPYEKSSIIFTSPFSEDLEISYKIQGPTLSAMVAYGNQHKFMINGDMTDIFNVIGSVTLICPYLPDINLKGKLETKSTNTNLEIVGQIDDRDVLLSLNCEIYAERDARMCKMNVEFTVGSMNIITVNFDYEMLNKSEFKTNFDITSNILISPDFSVEGHLEGKLNSLSSIYLAGYITGTNIEGLLNINHSIENSKLSSEFEASLNSFNLSYGMKGIVDFENMEASFRGLIESSISEINKLNLSFNHSLEKELRTTNFELSRGGSKFSISHAFAFTDNMNWYNEIILNDFAGMKTELQADSYKMEFTSEIFSGQDLIKLALKTDPKNTVIVDASLDTPWTLPLKVTVTGRGYKGQIKIVYGESKTTLDVEIRPIGNKTTGRVIVTNNMLEFTPLEIQFELNLGDEKSLEIKALDQNSKSVLVKLGHIQGRSWLQMEYQGQQKYWVHLEHEGTLEEGTVQTNFMIPCLSSTLIANKIFYAYKPMNLYLSGNSTYNENSYEFEFKFNNNEMRLTTQCPQRKTITSIQWKFEGERGVFSVFFEIPSKIKRSLDIFKEGNKFKVSYTREEDEFVFTGFYTNNSLTIKGRSPISGYRNINIEASSTSSSIDAYITFEDVKYILTCKFNLGSFRRGRMEMAIETPIEGYEMNKLLFNYDFTTNRSEINFATDIGPNSVINVNFEGSSEEILFEVMTPWTEKLSLKAAFENYTVKMTGEYNDLKFNWILKAYYDQKRKINVSMSLTSNIDGWSSYSITADANGSMKPYSAVIKIDNDDLETNTYSVVLNFDQESFSIELLTPFERFETLRAAGNYYHKENYFKTYFTISNKDYEINFSGSVSTKDDIPEIRVKVLTPFDRYENFEFTLDGSVNDQKSITVSATVGELEYYANLFLKHEQFNGKVGINIRSPFEGFRDISLNSVYKLDSETKIVKFSYNWNTENMILNAKVNENEIDISVESSIFEIQSFQMKGDYSKIPNGYKSQGFIYKNGLQYEFQGKAVMNSNDFDVEINMPSNDIYIQGTLLSDGIKITLTKGSNLFAESYDLKINYLFTAESSYLSIDTPFEFLSSIDLKLKTKNNMLDVELEMTKYSENYKVLGLINISPMKSNIALKVDIPNYFYNLNALYNFVSEEKYAEFERETSYSHLQYTVKALLNHGVDSQGYIKITTNYPNYSIYGAEYKIQSPISINNIDTFVALYNGEISETIKFGLKSEILDQSIIFIVETPIAEFEKIGLKLVKSVNGIESEVYFGQANAVFEVKMTPGEYLINIETPFAELNQAHLSFKYGWETFEKYGVLSMSYNDHKFELNGTLKKSWNNPQLILKFITPFEYIPQMELSGSYDLEKQQMEAGVAYNDLHFWINVQLDSTDSKFFISADIETPFTGWREVKYLTNIDFTDDKRIFRIFVERENNRKEIFINGKVTDDEMDFNFENSFENIPNLRTVGSLNRSKRSLNLGFYSKNHLAELTGSFNSLKITVNTPYPKAKVVTFEAIKTGKGFEINYKRNDNFINLAVVHQGKKKACSLTIKSALPGWELLALTGRLDLDEVRAYVSGHRNEKKIELTANGNFSAKQGKLQITMKTPFDKYKTVSTTFDYISKKKLITFESKSNSSDYHILLEFKKSTFVVDIFVPHPSENTVVKGKLSVFKGNLEATSRFTPFRTLNYSHAILPGAKTTINVNYERNGIKIFEFELVKDTKARTFHLKVDGRLFGNHSMIHYHRDGFKSMEAVYNRNGKELKLVVTGSGNLPRSGKLEFTIDNSFREVPRHIKGSVEVDRSGSPKTLIIKAEYPGSKLYVVNITYNVDLSNLKKGDFHIHITTPTKDRRIWKHIEGSWSISRRNILDATLTVGPKTFKIDGKYGLLDFDLTIVDQATGATGFIIWTIKRRSNGRDYYLKIGHSQRYVMFKFNGTFNTIWNGDVSGAFRASRYMKNDFVYSEKWNTKDGTMTGSGSFTLGKLKGGSKYTITRDPIARAAVVHWEANTNIPRYKNVKFDLDYSVALLKFNLKASWDTEYISFNTTLNNFQFKSSSNTIYFHIPKLGDGELTLSHDFNNPLAKSAKAVGKVGNKKISYIANWTRNKELTLFDFNGEVNSLILGSASLQAGFDLQDLKDAKAHLDYKRNSNKFAKINWHRKKTATHIENELTFSSHLHILPTARFSATADWSKGFHMAGIIEWNQSSINVNVDFTPGKITASITTPFKNASNIDFSLEYNMKKKEKTLTLHYARGSRVVHLTFSLKAGKKNGTLNLDLKTPFDLFKHISFNGKWNKSGFTATYKRNEDIQVDFKGTAEVKLQKSAFNVKFTPPSGKVVELSFSYDFQQFISGKGKRAAELIDFDIKLAGQTVKFTINGFRNSDKVFIETSGSTSFDKLSTFYLKIDSELNLTERVGHFEVRVNEFHFKVTNSFEKLTDGFYARTQIDTSATPLPGLIFGIGRDGDSYIITFGYGDDREVTVALKANNSFRNGFSGKLDIPKRGVNNLKFDINYSFIGENVLKTNIKLTTDDNQIIDAEILYDSDGVKARLASPYIGDHKVRARRSISDYHFVADFGIDDYGLTLEGNLLKGKKGFNLEGEIMGKKLKVDVFYTINRTNVEGEIHIIAPYIEEISSVFNISKTDNELHGVVQINYADHKLQANVDLDLYNTFNGGFKLIVDEYMLSSELSKQNDNSYLVDIILGLPFDDDKIAITVLFVDNRGLGDLNGIELSVIIRAPNNDNEKLNFGIKYIYSDVSFFSIEASPLNLKAETYFGVSNSIFNAGVDIETGIENWELTKVEAHVPLNGFSPKFSAKVNGIEYSLQVQNNTTEYGGDFVVQYFKDNNYPVEFDIDYRYKAPFHYGFSLKGLTAKPYSIDYGITFDSSFLFLLPSLHV